MVDNLVSARAINGSIDEPTDESTSRRQAQCLRRKVAYPDKWRDYDARRQPGSYYENQRVVGEWNCSAAGPASAKRLTAPNGHDATDGERSYAS
jgi:hypothetical protein